MSDDDSGLNRRKVLKNAGTAASGLVVSTGITAADGAAEPDEAKKRALESEYVQSMLDELDHPEIINVSTQQVAVEDWLITGIDLETELGTLTYGEDGNGDSTALFEFNQQVSRGRTRSQLPKKYRFPPQVQEAILTIDAEEGVVFMRTATPAEQRRLTKKTGVDADEAVMFYNSLIDGFEIHLKEDVTTQNDEPRAYLVEPPANSSNANISAGASSEVTDLSSMEADGVVTTSSCDSWAFRCMGSITICSACFLACGSAPVNPPAVAGCVLCVTGSCGLAVPVSCTKVVDECV